MAGLLLTSLLSLYKTKRLVPPKFGHLIWFFSTSPKLSIISLNGSDHISIHQNEPCYVTVENHLIRIHLHPNGSAILLLCDTGLYIDDIYNPHMHFYGTTKTDGRWRGHAYKDENNIK